MAESRWREPCPRCSGIRTKLKELQGLTFKDGSGPQLDQKPTTVLCSVCSHRGWIPSAELKELCQAIEPFLNVLVADGVAEICDKTDEVLNARNGEH